MILKKFFAIFVVTCWLYGGLYQTTFLFRFRDFCCV